MSLMKDHIDKIFKTYKVSDAKVIVSKSHDSNIYINTTYESKRDETLFAWGCVWFDVDIDKNNGTVYPHIDAEYSLTRLINHINYILIEWLSTNLKYTNKKLTKIYRWYVKLSKSMSFVKENVELQDTLFRIAEFMNKNKSMSVEQGEAILTALMKKYENIIEL